MVKVSREKHKGRPSRLTEEQKDVVVTLYNDGGTQKSIAEQFGVSLSTIRQVLEERR